jgi:hypothetical protein
MGCLCAAEALDRYDGAFPDRRDGERARIGGLAIEQNHAGPALLVAAAEPRSEKAKLVAQNR